MSLFTDKAKIYVPVLQSALGITRLQACGIFGNLGTETNGFRNLQEIKPIAGKGGLGWQQWTGPRRTQYTKWCTANSLDPMSDGANCRYLVEETKTKEAHSLEQLKKTNTLEAATETWMKQNLRPGIPHLDDRIKYAKIADEATRSTPTEVSKKVLAPVVIATTTAVVVPHHWYEHLMHPQALVIGAALVAVALGLSYYVYRRYKAFKAIAQ